MPEEEKPPIAIDFAKLKMRPQVRKRSPNHLSVYANFTNVESNFNDIRIVFGEVLEASTEKVVGEDKVTIIMSPEHAKSVAQALETVISQYEKLFGAIRTIPQ
jgi:hypothetical protein